MLIIRNKWIPFPHFNAVKLLGVLFVHHEVHLSPQLLNHERIHTAQILEMAIVGFYVWYVVEWVIRLFFKGNAYRKLYFEREAYANQNDVDYLRHRKYYAWIRQRF